MQSMNGLSSALSSIAPAQGVPLSRRQAHALERIPPGIILQMTSYLDSPSIGRFMSISIRVLNLGCSEHRIWRTFCERTSGGRDPYQALIDQAVITRHLPTVGEAKVWHHLYGARHQGCEPWSNKIIHKTSLTLSVFDATSNGNLILGNDFERGGLMECSVNPFQIIKYWEPDAYVPLRTLISPAPNGNRIQGEFQSVTRIPSAGGDTIRIQGRYGTPFEIQPNGDVFFQSNSQKVMTLETSRSKKMPMAVLTNGCLVVPSSQDPRQFAIYSPNGRKVASYNVHISPISAIAALPNGEFVTSDHNGYLRLWSRDILPLLQ